MSLSILSRYDTEEPLHNGSATIHLPRQFPPEVPPEVYANTRARKRATNESGSRFV